MAFPHASPESKAALIVKGVTVGLAMAGVLRAPKWSDHPKVPNKTIVSPGVHVSHSNGGMCSLLFSQCHIPHPAWAMGDVQRKWPHSIEGLLMVHD